MLTGYYACVMVLAVTYLPHTSLTFMPFRSVLLAQGIKKPELRDELYMQLLKQSRGNCTASSALAWELFYLVASAMPPSKDFVGLISEYVHTVRAYRVRHQTLTPRPTCRQRRAAQQGLCGPHQRVRAHGAWHSAPQLLGIHAFVGLISEDAHTVRAGKPLHSCRAPHD